MSYIKLVVFAVFIVQGGDSMLTENKRSVIDLATVIEKVTGSLALKFAAYGCYCGIGGRGEPLDEIDRCCKVHDNCYSTMHHNFWHYFRGYRFHLENGNVKCDSGDIATCRCDGRLAECLRDNLISYNPAYELHSKHTLSGKVNIVTRDQWCARSPKETEQMNTPVKFVFVHHTAMAECLTEKDCCEEVRKIQNAHMDNKGWDDIGYSFLIGEDGQVFEGRGWDRVGAHTYGWNRIAVAFSIMGNYMTRIPNQKAIEALKAIISVGISKGKIEKDYRLYGHKDVGNTECPGIKLYELISKWPEYGPLPPVKSSA